MSNTLNPASTSVDAADAVAAPAAASYRDFTAIRVTVEAGVAWVTLDHPPLNVIDVVLGRDLHDFAARVARDSRVRVVVYQSANPDYFAAHADIGWIFDPSTLMELADPDAGEGLNPLQQLNERLRNLPQVTIAKLRGRARAGGAELAMTADMRFAAAGQAWLGQPETLMGLFPGGGGTQYLTRLLGRARALEVVLGAELFDTNLAERYGWINRAINPDQLDSFVDTLARRIAALPAGLATAAITALDAAEASGAVPHLTEESAAHAAVYPSPQPIIERMRDAVEAGAQSPAGEHDLEGLLNALPWPAA
jgi:enoyl-CoA hydratase/carnithine racemase